MSTPADKLGDAAGREGEMFSQVEQTAEEVEREREAIEPESNEPNEDEGE